MGLDVTIAVCTFGGQKWVNLAAKRAVPSAESFPVPVLQVHADTLMDARNFALEDGTVTTEWLCYLDADDELEPGYFDHMDRATADLRAPSVRYVGEGVNSPPDLPPFAYDRNDLSEGNWLVIGTLVRTELARQVGWRDWAFYEDWDFWQRCWLTGATIEAVPDAVYRARWSYDSRNRAPGRSERVAMHHAIRRANMPHLYEKHA